MPTMIKAAGQGWELADQAPAIDWKTLDEWQPGEALRLQVDDEPTEQVTQASHIAIDFPAFTDGRGLSLAVLLRTRLNYTGELHATGAIHEDILHYLVRCGFDWLALPEGRDATTALEIVSPYSLHYQHSVRAPGNV